MISITWHNAAAKGWRDDLPLSWFKGSNQAKLSHLSWPPRGASVVAVCSLRLDGEKAYLDYGHAHQAENEANDIYPDLLRLTFSDRKRDVLVGLEWMEEDGKYAPCPASWSDSADIEIAEGDAKLVKHLRRERDANLRDMKIAAAGGDQSCQACGFDAATRYGMPYCEVHHEDAIKGGPRMTKLERLAILCANCHRAIHRIKPMPSVSTFKTMIAASV
ncbi:HNH endonuclease [Sphingomonas sp. CROZ-RG-20F-R02-07]|uniref:HNH endonuclease n=1 Tax=Sphingomonas sp. CROZ-RG-20F-R02-07 TaxID=2914832 RepID=UPI001F5685A5|nr:HNH endonuclease [Sphingomonas sp. CROZ-RG-20F-R02-07]